MADPSGWIRGERGKGALRAINELLGLDDRDRVIDFGIGQRRTTAGERSPIYFNLDGAWERFLLWIAMRQSGGTRARPSTRWLSRRIAETGSTPGCKAGTTAKVIAARRPGSARVPATRRSPCWDGSTGWD
jgi:hypothetical protein